VLGRWGFKKSDYTARLVRDYSTTMYHSGVAEDRSLLRRTVRRVDR